MGSSTNQRQNYRVTVTLMTVVSVVATALILGLRGFGGLERLELLTYDWMMRLRPTGSKDNRILVVGITEQDLQERGGILQLPDQVYADLLAKLWSAQPRAIGLDVYRDTPIEPGHQAFVQQIRRSDRFIGITKIGDETQPSIPPPKALPIEQVGFNDVLVDEDGIIRRALLYQPGDSGILPSFSLQLALRYLQDNQIEPQASAQRPEDMQLRQTVFVPLQPNDGGYAQADTRGYQVLLNYRGTSQTIPTVSLGAILRGEVPTAQIRNRIVLIGNIAESARDFFHTPFSIEQIEPRMAGVVIHAQMVSQFLEATIRPQQLFWVWPELIEGMWILGWAILGSLLAQRSSRPLTVLVTVLLSLLALWGLCLWAFLSSGWIPLIPPALSFLLTTGSVVAYSAQQAQQQQQMVMRLLGQNASSEIADTLWQRRDELLQNGKLPGQQITATIMFSDIKGFSSISEKSTPKQLLNWLNEYLDVMTQQVQQHQGVINKFMGDGIMTVFGVPIAHEQTNEIQQDAQNAVDCALAMGQALETLNQQWQQEGLPQVKIRVGIYTGSVVVGSIGSPIRLEFGVIGDGVNIASRLESLDKNRQPSPCRILIAQQTRDYLSADYELESWGSVMLKGRQLQVEVYRVIGHRQR
jgi:adenylate cyclase